MKKHWFNCKVSYMKPDSEGTEAKKTEQFVLDAYTYTEAETRMVEVLESEGIRPFEITQITKTTLIEVIRFAECDKWFRVKISLSTVDESKGVEKEANQYILVSVQMSWIVIQPNQMKNMKDITGESHRLQQTILSCLFVVSSLQTM